MLAKLLFFHAGASKEGVSVSFPVLSALASVEWEWSPIGGQNQDASIGVELAQIIRLEHLHSSSTFQSILGTSSICPTGAWFAFFDEPLINLTP